MPQTIVQRAFSGGELSPALAARADLAKYHQALKVCRNFLVKRNGGVSNRPGTQFVGPTKGNQVVTFGTYVSEVPGASCLIECGDGYFRFYNNGGPVMDGGSPYEIAHPFGADRPRMEQSGAVITLTHQNHPPHELVHFDTADWLIRLVETKPALPPPTGIIGTESEGPGGSLEYRYVVTAADRETYEESEPSSPPWIVYRNDPPTKAQPFTLIFDGIQDAVKLNAAEYYVYLDPFRNGIYGFLATAVWDGVGAFHFHDIGFPPDFSQSPPIVVRIFDAPSDYPAVATYYQQRRFFANTEIDPEGVWGSRIGFPGNFGISSPLQDDDAVSFHLAGRQRHPVRHLVGLEQLVVLTGAGEWVVYGDGGPLIPTGIQASQVAYWGASEAVPVVIGQTIIYVQARGRIVRDLVLNAGQGAQGRDLTLLANHLFTAHTIDELAYQQNPHSIVWAVRSDGTLLGLTYVPDDDVWGWHRHDTAGTFLEVASIPEHDQDTVYVLVERGGQRYIERFASRDIVDMQDAWFLDSALAYNGPATSTVSGLDHLEGQVVGVFADGRVVFNGDPASPQASSFTVSAGGLTLPAPFSRIVAGLRIAHAELQTLDIDIEGGSIRDRRKRVQGVTLIVEKSSQQFQAGPDLEHLFDFFPETWQKSSALVDDAYQMNITATWTDHGRVVIRQNEPLPLTVLGILPLLDIGG